MRLRERVLWWQSGIRIPKARMISWQEYVLPVIINY